MYKKNIKEVVVRVTPIGHALKKYREEI